LAAALKPVKGFAVLIFSTVSSEATIYENTKSLQQRTPKLSWVVVLREGPKVWEHTFGTFTWLSKFIDVHCRFLWVNKLKSRYARRLREN